MTGTKTDKFLTQLQSTVEAGLADVLAANDDGYMTRIGQIITIFVRDGDGSAELTFNGVGIDPKPIFAAFEEKHGREKTAIAERVWSDALHG